MDKIFVDTTSGEKGNAAKAVGAVGGEGLARLGRHEHGKEQDEKLLSQNVANTEAWLNDNKFVTMALKDEKYDGVIIDVLRERYPLEKALHGALALVRRGEVADELEHMGSITFYSGS